MTSRIACTGTVAGVLVLLAAGACSAPAGNTPPPERIDLGVSGAINRMPSIGVSGDRVVVVWTATRGDVMQVYAATSEDAGRTYSPPRLLSDATEAVSANAEQAPRVAVSDGAATVIWPAKIEGRSTIRMARSHDGGRTFDAPASVSATGLTGLRGWQALTSGPDAAHAAWLDGRYAEPSATSGGRTGGHHHHAARGASTGASPRVAPRQDLFSAVISPDGSIAETHVARDVCFCCKTAVGVGASGRVYVAWRHIFADSMRDIALAVSSDGGRTFAPFVRVSQDNWQLSGCPDDGPALAVDARDTVHIAWPTLVGGAEPRKGIFYSFATEATRFAPRVQLSGEGVEDAGHPQVAVDAAGNVAAAWDEQAGDKRNIVVRVSRSGSRRFEAARILTPDGSGLNPHVAGLARGFLVAWPSGSGAGSAIRVARIGL